MLLLQLTGIANNVNTVLGLIQRLEPAILAIPEVKGLIEAAISTFSHEDKSTIEKAYAERMAKTDADHLETQKELQQAGATVEGSGEEDASAKGGGA